MAVNTIYRQTWTKPNGWNVRADFIAAGGDAAFYNARTVTDITGVFKEVSSHTGAFDKYPIAVAQAQTAKFKIDYTRCPTAMKTALDKQFVALTGSEADYTAGYYTSQTGFKQPNVLVIWSDRGTDLGIPATCTITTAGTGFTSASGVATDAQSPSAGVGLTVDITADYNHVDAVTIVNPGTGYSDTHSASTTGGTGTGCVLDISTSAGAVTTINSIVNAGQNYTAGDTLTITGGANDATVTVDTVSGTGAITAVVLHDGVHYEVGDTVLIDSPGGTDCILTIDTLVDPTWSVEFVGAQRAQPTEKYKELPSGDLEIEIDAVGIHKLAMEWQIDGAAIIAAYRSLTSTEPLTECTSIQLYKFPQPAFPFSSMVVATAREPKLHYWMMKLSTLMSAIEYINRERYGLILGHKWTFGDTSFSFDTADIKFYKQHEATAQNPYAQGTQVNFSDIYFLAGATDSDNPHAIETAINGKFGLLTADKDGFTSKAKTGWDLWKQICEQLWVKATPYHHFTGSRLRSDWHLTSPFGTSYSVPTYAYNSGIGAESAEFERNRDRMTGKAKIHFLAHKDDLAEWESYTGSKDEDGFEVDSIWSIDIMNQLDTVNHTADQNITDGFLLDLSTNTMNIKYGRMPMRGLFYLDSGTWKALSPLVDFRITPESSFATDATPITPTGLTPTGGRNEYMNTIIESQKAETNFKTIARAYVTLFGSNSNQTGYDLDLPLSEYVLPERVGHRGDITPHSALSSYISEKSYMVSCEVDWSSRAEANSVKTKWLTRAIEND